jgi:hypothetical protein
LVAGQENRNITARVRRAKQAGHERAGLPHLIGPARERRAFPNRHSSHQHTALPAATPPGKAPGRRADTQGCTLDSAANVKPEQAAE